MTDELTPSVISRDRLTNELIALRAEHIRIPLVLCGITLNEEQKKTLKEGKPLYIENIFSKRGTLFNATVQFNAEKTQCRGDCLHHRTHRQQRQEIPRLHQFP